MKPQLHQSEMSSLEYCAYGFYLRKTLGPKAPGIALSRGSATHVAIELNMRRKLDTGELAPLDEVEQAARDCVGQEFERGIYLAPDERKAKAVEAWRDETVDAAVGLSSLHYHEVAPTVTPTHVERRWAVQVPGLSYDLAGQIDLQEVYRARPRVIDAKTSARTPSQADIDTGKYSLQFSVYGLAVKVIDLLPPCFRLDGLVNLKSGPKLVQLETHRTNEQYQALLDTVAAYVRQIELGDFPPNGRHSWKCCDKWCGYHEEDCKYVRGYKVFQLGGQA